MRPLLPALAFTLLTACSPADAPSAQPSVSQAWVRLPAVPGRPAAAYMTIEGGAAPDTVVEVRADKAQRAELHESMEGHGAMSMEPVKTLILPAQGRIVFAPGGKHVMLFGLDPALKPGGTMPLTVVFEKAGAQSVTASLVGPADAPPGAEHAH